RHPRDRAGRRSRGREHRRGGGGARAMSGLEVGMVCFASVGGSGTVAVELAHALDERGHRARVIAQARPPRMRPTTAFTPVQAPAHPLLSPAPYTLALAGTLAAAQKARPFDVVHLHFGVPHAASALLLRAALGPSCPALVLTLHGTDVTALADDP